MRNRASKPVWENKWNKKKYSFNQKKRSRNIEKSKKNARQT